jgi:hypothetical protein
MSNQEKIEKTEEPVEKQKEKRKKQPKIEKLLSKKEYVDSKTGKPLYYCENCKCYRFNMCGCGKK